MIRVVIADDQPLILSGLSMLLDAAPDIDIVAEAADGLEAVECASRLQPDLVVMDIRMPRMDGVEATRRITADAFSNNPDAPVKVLVLTTYNIDATVRDAIRAGASGFMLKDSVPAELIAATRAIARGEAWLQPVIARGLISEFAAMSDPPSTDHPHIDRLTVREHEVLVQIARGLSNAEIAERLHIGEVTVKTHVGRIFNKLDLRDRAHAVIIAYEAGIVVPGRN